MAAEIPLTRPCPISKSLLRAYHLDADNLEDYERWTPLVGAQLDGGLPAYKLRDLAETGADIADQLRRRRSATRLQLDVDARAAIDEMAFLAPIHVGDIVRTYAQVNWAGRTSLEVGVRVESEPWDVADTTLHVASAYVVFVAIDASGHPREVAPLAVEDPEDARRLHEAEIRRAHRLARKSAIEAHRSEG